MLARRTIHPPSACKKVCLNKGIVYPKRRKCPKLNESIDEAVGDDNNDTGHVLSVDDIEYDGNDFIDIGSTYEL
jgi:hypothetical protein